MGYQIPDKLRWLELSLVYYLHIVPWQVDFEGYFQAKCHHKDDTVQFDLAWHLTWTKKKTIKK